MDNEQYRLDYYCLDFEESDQDRNEHGSLWTATDNDEYGHQDLNIYEADSEDQDTDMDRDDDDHQNINPSEDQCATQNLKLIKEIFEESALNKHNIHNRTPNLPQISKPDPSPTPNPHHETIATGQHHLWMI